MPSLTIPHFPSELHARLQDRAQQHNRSLDQEAIHCIEIVVQMSTPESQSPTPHDTERAEWLALSERNLMQTWDNTADDIFNELLAK